MMIFVYGSNQFLASEKIAQLKGHFAQKFDKTGMNLVEFPLPGTEIDLGSVMQIVQTPPFISDKRMVIIKNLVSSLTKPLSKPWVDFLKTIPESTIVVFEDNESIKKFEKREIFLQFRSKDGVFTYPFSVQTITEVEDWAKQEVRRLRLNIDGDLLSQVVAMVGIDLFQLSSELRKLRDYSQESSVTREMISDLVKANFEDQMFVFIDAVGAKNKKKTLQLLTEQRESGSADMHIFAMLARQIRLLLGARSILDNNPRATKVEVAEILKIHPFVAQKTLAQARSFDLVTLKALHTMVYKFDRGMKNGQIQMDVAVDRLVIQMLG
ncbi:DNA polymerase III subunit delta [Candidatus Uhrbacteria bacterium CG_4_10_14_0_2_um_filter_41_7]|uniref:DNA polymerase III subunit delta n=1 Tax=Candidatus Uhrbacteria bacterium CG_4_9_14_3_um_filter_41_35 TaxID=1975034 RepID=A0A2M7XGL6_9BACT|nr:MAG: DNA polymerase III subunit delta [Candidatus Uhrbacteria bacterium CG11_big_fil_rev_8_21_14_0_20_41_9]PIZ55505.1 MAG: DNA polymerase III subunit delta [Candidatus Uhrbacteria bacterium CG_4_10_14_0_2_um_filter_41_7]PJA47017.1 MAG: DNA polymerase III subunit delta [Candidatus Uhrbacteria bacterium CG_4_9_14_3_um_filter_41_35]